MKILAIDTSCDETAAAVTEGVKILSNIIWSQASLHAKFGGVMPSLAQRQHEERIDWIIKKSLLAAGQSLKDDIDAIAVTCGPGLAIALGVGIDRAKDLARKYKKPLIPINHLEAHLLSPLAKSKTTNRVSSSKIHFPAFGLILSGKNTQVVIVNRIGNYKVLAETVDDALGEALDKSARLLGLGYPGGAILESFAKEGNPGKYNLPLPLKDEKIKDRFSYSGLKAAFVRLVKQIGDPDKEQIRDLAASFQDIAFNHVLKVLDYQIVNNKDLNITQLLFGGGVTANIEIRKRLRKLCKKHALKLLIPYTNKLTTDNAGMVGVCAYLKINNEKSKLKDFFSHEKIDRDPRAKIDKPFFWQYNTH